LNATRHENSAQRRFVILSEAKDLTEESSCP
jgi:hypothetical protein